MGYSGGCVKESNFEGGRKIEDYTMKEINGDAIIKNTLPASLSYYLVYPGLGAMLQYLGSPGSLLSDTEIQEL